MKLLNKLLKKNSFELTNERKECLEILENTDQNLIILGRAGTGKSVLIDYFRNTTKKNVVVLAPTAIASLNVHGQTIHSFFGFPPKMIDLQSIRKFKTSRIYCDIDTLIIDEISMVRADLLDAVEKFLRLNGKDEKLPFGGTQIVFVGDLFQLAPVVTQEEADIYHFLYETPYFFSANCFRLHDFGKIELKTIYRQREIEFINLLNKVREGDITLQDLELINSRVHLEKIDDKYIILCSINKVGEAINLSRLEEINKPLFTYEARIEDDFPTENRYLPADLLLKLKIGAKIVFVKNDSGGQWVNGTIGKIYKLDNESIWVRLDDSDKVVKVEIEHWDNIKYEYDQKSGHIIEKVIGKYWQYPIRLAWAITIHKSQGMTFDHVCIDFSRSPFAHGQTYVALSRCRSLSGLILTCKIYPNDILVDPRIVEFNKVSYLDHPSGVSA